jgi:hypothetical protein
MNKFHDVQQIDFEDTNLILSVDGQEYRLPLSAVSSKLARGSDTERRIYQISPSGYGVRWPIIDEDLSIDGLLKLAASLSEHEPVNVE